MQGEYLFHGNLHLIDICKLSFFFTLSTCASDDKSGLFMLFNFPVIRLRLKDSLDCIDRRRIGEVILSPKCVAKLPPVQPFGET